MWPRAVELMIAMWLLMSPYIFGHDPAAKGLWVSDFACAAVIFTASSLSFWKTQPKLRWAYLTNIAVSLWLIAFGYLAGGYPTAPGYTNELIVGLVLLLFAIVPNEADQPPRSWREFYARRART